MVLVYQKLTDSSFQIHRKTKWNNNQEHIIVSVYLKKLSASLTFIKGEADPIISDMLKFNFDPWLTPSFQVQL